MKLALVTGGCHRLGAAISAGLAENGYALALHASAEPVPDATLEAVLKKNDTPWHGFAADFSDPGETGALVAKVSDRFGEAPGLLVNSAAIFGGDRPENADYEELIAHYAVNCAAPAVLCRDFAASGDGAGRSIVNILDQRIAAPHGDQFGYTLSKFALAGMTRILAREFAPALRVNAVAPGLTIPTDDYDRGRLERLAGAMPLDRLPAPAQVADAVLWLAAAKAVTGQTIFVDGGAHMESYGRDFVHLEI